MGSHAIDEHDTYAFFDSVCDMSTAYVALCLLQGKDLRWLRKRAKVQDKNNHLSRSENHPNNSKYEELYHDFYC